MAERQTNNVAVFIDFENIALSAVNFFGEFDLKLLFEQIEKRGRVTIKRAYGDWSRLGKYRDALREHAVDTVQLYSYNYHQGGKNRADIRLVIDVMEALLQLNHIETVVIVSGDSDFSPLVSKVREYGKYAIGIGVQTSTSDLLIKACDEFIFYDDLVEAAYEQLKARREESAVVESSAERAAAAVAEAAAVEAAEAEAAAVDAAETASEAAAEAPSRSLAASQPSRVEQTASQPVAPTSVVTLLPPPVTVTLSAPPVPPPAATDLRSERETLRYFFDDLRLPIVPPDARSSILSALLDATEPGATLNQAVDKLKARYDYENVYRKREDIRTVARLAYRAGIFDFGKECPSLSSYVRRVAETDPERANRLADRTLLRIALEANLTLTPPAATSVLFAPARDEGYCVGLLDELIDEGLIERSGNSYFLRETDAISRLLQSPKLAEVRQDVERFPLRNGERVTLEEADRLFDTASAWRRRDFVASASCALKGLKMLFELYREREPGVGPDEFMWGAASYCSARAGVFFRSRDYTTARKYYLAFFWIAQEGDFAWELLRPLLPSLLSYYCMTLSHELEIRIGSFSGHTPPGDAVIALVEQLDDFGLIRMEDLAFKLAQANAAQLRSLIAQIEAAAPSAQRQRTLKVLHTAHERFTNS